MATATRYSARTGHKAGTQVKGTITAEVQHEGAWLVQVEDTYNDEQYRRNALADHLRWVNSNDQEVRRVVEHCTVDGKPRHIIRGENQPRKPADGGWEQEEHDAAALRQFLADATGLKWRVESGMHGQRAVDLAETPAPMSGWQREYTRNGATYDAPNL